MKAGPEGDLPRRPGKRNRPSAPRPGRQAGTKRSRAAAGARVASPDLARGLVHEILNPVAAVQAAVQILVETEPLSRQAREIATEIQGQLEQVDRVLHQWLDFVCPLQARPERIPVQALLESAASQAAGRLEVRVSRRSPLYALVDLALLQKALMEVLSNAEAAGATQIDVSATLSGTAVSLRIRNNGPLLDPESVGRAFQPFFSTRPGRAGLGLPLARRWITAMDGRIEVLDERDGFAVMLPAVK